MFGQDFGLTPLRGRLSRPMLARRRQGRGPAGPAAMFRKPKEIRLFYRRQLDTKAIIGTPAERSSAARLGLRAALIGVGLWGVLVSTIARRRNRTL